MTPMPPVLSIAGVDPSGGAGVLADVKTFSALGAYGMGVITALTAQNTQGVTGAVAVEPAFIRQQVDTLVADIRPAAVKVGMLATAPVAGCVGDFLAGLADDQHVVLDPVMVATSGDRLLDPAAEGALRDLLPLASLITPNLPEAAALLNREPATDTDEMRRQAEALRALGAPRVYLKAGHLTGRGEATDLYLDDDGIVELAAPWVDTRNTHGTGCTLSSALAALRAQRDDWPTACRDAKAWLTEALRHADELGIGHGHGPVHHFWAQQGARA